MTTSAMTARDAVGNSGTVEDELVVEVLLTDVVEVVAVVVETESEMMETVSLP